MNQFAVCNFQFAGKAPMPCKLPTANCKFKIVGC